MSETTSRMRSESRSGPRVEGWPEGQSGAGTACGATVRSPSSVSVQAALQLRRADALLSEAVGEPTASERFRCAYLGALKGAAAVLAASGGARAARRPRSRSAWVLMSRAEPEFGRWADYFAGHSALRASVEAGVAGVVTEAEADRFHTEVGRFLTAVEEFLVDGGVAAEAREASA